MSETRVQLVSRQGPWKATYEGGPYIEVWHESKSYPLDVINVYDYAKGEPEIAFEQSAVRRELRHWINEVGDDYINELPYL